MCFLPYSLGRLLSTDSVEKVAPLCGLRQNFCIGQQGSTQHDETVIEWAYSFNLEDHIPATHLLRSIDRCLNLSDQRHYLTDFYSPIGRPSIDPELMIRMLLLRHSLRAAVVRRGPFEPGVSVVLPVKP